MGRSAADRREDLVALYKEARGCTLCPLHEGRTQVVFGAGNADADLMFVGEAPGFHEDQQGIPFVGRAGQLLNELLAEQGLARDDVFIANVLKCLRYNAQVQLGDGNWERIGRLVRSRYAGTVMSVGEDGALVPRKVTGWHATPLAGRTVYRLTYCSAKKAGASQSAVQLTGDHPVLTRRGFVPAAQLVETDEVATGQGLPSIVEDVVCGTLLGDGSLARSTAMLSFSHSAKQREYAEFKRTLLSDLGPTVSEHRVAAVAGGERQHEVIHVRTRAHRALGVLRSQFYDRRRKVVPRRLGHDLTPLAVAVWFMDDGHLRVRPNGRRPMAEIATDCFSDTGRVTLQRGLRRLGLSSTSARGRLYFNTTNTHLLSRLIAPYVPSCMRHKVSPEVSAEVPFDPAAFRKGRPQVLYDRVTVEDVTDHERADTTFFCIDVEGTHNFVTAGGVVHNCRPPDNRDPQPDEIETCRPYLERQVELIEPRVICTLGNFATKLLTGSPQGITRVHGVPQERELGARTVQLFPIFHPAAGLRTPAVKEQLREDFAKLPALLSEPVEQEPAPEAGHAGGEPATPAPRDDQLGLFG